MKNILEGCTKKCYDEWEWMSPILPSSENRTNLNQMRAPVTSNLGYTEKRNFVKKYEGPNKKP